MPPGNPDAFVSDAEERVWVGTGRWGQKRDPPCVRPQAIAPVEDLFAGVGHADAHINLPSGRRVADGVGDEVLRHLHKLKPIAHDEGRALRQAQTELHPLPFGHRREGVDRLLRDRR
jgi:hypothetical protein